MDDGLDKTGGGSDPRDLWLRNTVEFLQREVTSLSHQVQERDRRIDRLERENRLLRQRLEEQQPPPPPPTPPPSALPPPPFVKPPVGKHRRKRPGRKEGHDPALRPPPPKIDRTVDVPLPKDRDTNRPACPNCATGLRKLKWHDRLVEDLVPAKVVVTRYHTRSGWCPCCKCRVESRHPEQPPPANLPHAQLGVNALSAVGVLRLANRLPMRQVSDVLADLKRLKLCAGAISKQLQRLGRWLSGEWELIKRRLRGSAEAVNADETTWRTDGDNQWLWALCDPRHTLYHVDASRGGKVIRRLLGKAFGGKLITDFYAAYNTMNCCQQQKCLTHLLRELRETAARSPACAASGFHKRCKRLVKELLGHKQRWDELDDQTYNRLADRLEKRLADLAATHLEDADADVRRLAERLWRHREQLTAFLWHRAVEGTNNAAERALRPIVVARKISGGSRSKAGARATAVLASVLRTARQQGLDLMATLKRLLMNCWAGQEPGLVLA
jgi:transposase